MNILLTILSLFTLALPKAVFAGSFNYTWYMTLKKDKRETFMRRPLFVSFSQDGNRAYIVDGTGKLFSYSVKRGVPKPAFFAKGVLNKPVAMAKFSKEKIIVINRGNQEIDIINLKTRKIEKIRMRIIPDKIFIHKGYIYILDRLTGDIYKFNNQFNVKEVFTHGKDDGFIDFKIRKDKIVCLKPISKTVVEFDLKTGKRKAIKLEDKNHKLLLPVSIDIDKNGFIYICDKDAGNIKIYNSQGALLDIILERGEKRGKLYYPSYINFDKYGNLWIAEEGNGRVEVFDKQTAKSKK
ncbi:MULTISPECIES: NHL repeat-containing protein [unclassified Desulfurobacterium]|uniref:hypothetical protein n=1 Tax=Desulfurobacterium sp. TC5-1 TaxID=1158318 RepID=UPI0003B48DD3|nr:hypothetical protein [Desulfurobacterium sp. TC5-1]